MKDTTARRRSALRRRKVRRIVAGWVANNLGPLYGRRRMVADVLRATRRLLFPGAKNRNARKATARFLGVRLEQGGEE